jgi:hypothetical protein
MTPVVAEQGRSFKWAGMYYLHDKGHAKTSERVVFTHTLNLPTDNPETAVKCMAYTAMRADELKAAAGKKKTGNKRENSVYSYSLSWHPEERPTKDDMIEAAMETLKVLRLTEHEVLIVAHNDEPHAHIHVIVNRVHPETGIAANHYKDQSKLSRWAQDYQRRHGKDYCPQRVINNALRDQGKFVKYRPRLSKAEYYRSRREQLKVNFDRREPRHLRLEPPDITRTHLTQREALYREKEARIQNIRRRISAAHRPEWAELFRRQRDEKRDVNLFQKTVYHRLYYFLKNYGADRGIRDAVKGALAAIFGRDNPHGTLEKKHRAERRALVGKIRDMTREAMREENRHYRAELEQLRRLQKSEIDHIREAQQREAAEIKRQMAEHAALAERAMEAEAEEHEETGPPTPAEDFTRAAGKRIRRPRRPRNRRRDKDPGRERDD